MNRAGDFKLKNIARESCTPLLPDQVMKVGKKEVGRQRRKKRKRKKERILSYIYLLHDSRTLMCAYVHVSYMYVLHDVTGYHV